MEELLLQGCILYAKNGKIGVITPPEYGEIKLKIQNNNVVLITETKTQQV